ncbi:hypothetical protein WG947_04485 [Pontibacter sp. H259]|uniref:hypothetical protein n=1 Tax=Pontibacter sp. H259 TaxID=3133421 RepID=UPI0030BC7FED
MKKIFYLLSSLMLVFTACDPMEDVYEELEKTGSPKKTLAITLQDADYKAIKSAPSNITTGLYFTSEAQASEFIPGLLNTKYGHLNNNDVIDVTYKQASHTSGKTVSERVEFTLTTKEDYALGGTTFTNFDKWSQVETFLNAKYPDAKEGRLVKLTYTWYNSGAAYPKPDGTGTSQSKTVTENYYFSGGKWYEAYTLVANDYATADRTRYSAFFSSDEAELVPSLLNNLFKKNVLGAKAGDVKYGAYLVRYSGTNIPVEVMPMVYDGSNWTRATKAVTKEATLSFKKKQGVWVPDPIIKYTLTTADYIWIGDNPALGTPENRANLKEFKSFYQRFSDDSRFWTQAQVIAALGALLKEKFPTAEVGNKFEVTYVVHTGPTGPTSIILELQESGNYIVPVE